MRGLILPRPRRGGDNNAQRVRNVITGRVLPCCWSDCERDGDTRHRIELWHPQPQVEGEKLVYIFCSDAHRAMYAAGSDLARIVH